MTGEVESVNRSKARLRLWLRLLKSTRGIEAQIRERLRIEFATTLPRFDVLAALSRSPDGLRMSEVSGVLRVSNGNVTGIVDRLVNEGQVARSQMTDDRRAYLVKLTSKGRAEFDKQAAEHEKWIDEILGSLDAEQSRRMMDLLDLITQPKEDAR